jgi:sugar lactone lactonase YvrE
MFLCAAISCAQQYVISTVAGGGALPTPVSATAVPLSAIGGIATDSFGNVYFTGSNSVFKLDTSGMLTLVAGNARAGFSGDGGPAASAQFNSPAGIAIDGTGNVYVADRGNARVRRIAASGIITTVAGGGTNPPYADGGPAAGAILGFISGVAVDASGNLFVSDSAYNAVRKVSANGIMTTVAGTGSSGYSGDGGPAVRARLADPAGLAVDKSGNLFIADSGNSCVRKVAAEGTITTFAGTGFYGFSGDNGSAANAQLAGPEGVALDASGNVFITDSGNDRLRKVSTNGLITTVAGNGTYGLTGDGGPALAAELTGPADIAVDSSGNILIDGSGLNLGSGFGYVFAAGWIVNGFLGEDPLTGILFRSAGSGISVLRKISTGGIIATVAGNASSGLFGIGSSATKAQFGSVQGIAVDGSGNLFIADPIDNCVLKVSTAGIVTTVAGNGTFGFSGDAGPANSAQLAYPVAVAVDGAGNLFIADQDNGRIRRVSAGGTITTVAGNGNAGYAGDGGPALSAEIARPAAVAVDGPGNIFFLDTNNSVVRKVSTGGIITTVAGNGTAGYLGDKGLA